MFSPYRCPKCRYSSYNLGRVTRHIQRCVDGKKGPLVAGQDAPDTDRDQEDTTHDTD